MVTDLKKVEQFKARLKLLDKEQMEALPALLQQAMSLNLSKFVVEVQFTAVCACLSEQLSRVQIVNNLAESKLLKTSDITKSVQVASCLHQVRLLALLVRLILVLCWRFDLQRYAEFTPLFLNALLRYFGLAKMFAR